MFTCSHSISQQVSLFQNITTANGLPSNYVFDITEDNNGFLWAGTDKGLARYDGFRWRLFTIDQGLPGNYISMVKNADRHGLWLLVSTKGLYHYNISTGKCSFLFKDILNHSFETNTTGDLFFYEQPVDMALRKGRFISRSNPLLVNTAFEIVTANSKSVIVDFENKSIISFRRHVNNLSEPKIKFLLQGWKLRATDLVVPDSGHIIKVDGHIYKSQTSLYVVKPHNAIKKLKLFKNDNIYLNSLRYQNQTVVWDEKSGLYFVTDSGAVKNYTDKDGLTNPYITDVHVAKNGNLLISTLGGGIFYMLPGGNAVISTDDKPVKGIAQKDNHIYALTENKLLLYDLLTSTCKTFSINEQSVQAVDVWGNDIFISSLSGFGVYGMADNRLYKKYFQKHNAGVSNVILSDGRYYTGSYGTGIFTFNHAGKKYEEFSSTPFVSERLQVTGKGYVSYNYEDGAVFFNNDGSRLSVTVKDGLPSNAVYHVHEYKDSQWISTAKGVAVYAKGKWVKNFTTSDGITGGKCRYSFHDNDGRFYVVSDKFLNIWNGKNFITLSSAAIIHDKYDIVSHCSYHSASNSLISGSLHEIFIVQLDRMAAGPSSLVPGLLYAKTDDEKNEAQQSFKVAANYQTLQFQFHPVDANPFSQPAIYYKLEGYQKDYTLLTDSLEISFSKLRSGRYTLLAKVIGADGVAGQEKKLATFTIKPPFLQSGLFMLLATILASGCAISIYYLLQRRKKRKLKREIEMEARLNNERERISKDLHDHLGTAIVTMIAQADNIEFKLMHNNQQGALEKVKELSEQSRETVNVLRETIWAVQENSHSLDEFILRTKNFLQRVLPQKNINWTVGVTEGAALTLTANQSLQLFRVLQECTQNIIKHAQAGLAVYTFSRTAAGLTITIFDNGRGMTNESSRAGNGLMNMEQRIQSIGGYFSYGNKSPSGFETVITLSTEIK